MSAWMQETHFHVQLTPLSSFVWYCVLIDSLSRTKPHFKACADVAKKFLPCFWKRSLQSIDFWHAIRVAIITHLTVKDFNLKALLSLSITLISFTSNLEKQSAN